MNRTDRLLAIVLELQARGTCRAEDLAAVFEVSKRTIYRDLDALNEAGVPVIAMPGQGFSLVEGYFLPPLSFTEAEATILLLGADVVRQSVDADFRAAAEWAARKIEGVLPDAQREKVHWLKDSMTFLPSASQPAQDMERLQLLRRAILKEHTIRFRYHTRHTDEYTEAVNTRDADPYGLGCVGGVWYLMAYCHLRNGIRHFRLSRMDEVTVLPRTFRRPPEYRMLHGDADDGTRQLTVRALFDDNAATWVLEERFFFMTDAHPTPDGLLVTLRCRQPGEVLPWLLGWGRRVRVIEPDFVRNMVADEARALLESHLTRESVST